MLIDNIDKLHELVEWIREDERAVHEFLDQSDYITLSQPIEQLVREMAEDSGQPMPFPKSYMFSSDL